MKKLIFILSSLLIHFPANAHIKAETGGFWEGFAHPILGFDHFIAMLSVGIISAQRRGHFTWLLPAIFMVFMFTGAKLAMMGQPLLLTEFAIAMSLVLFGLSIACSYTPVVWVASIATAFFGVFHGYAHGSEIPRLANPEAMISGFMLGTATIHLFGVSVTTFFHTSEYQTLLRHFGSACSGVGLYLSSEYFPLMFSLLSH